MAYMSGTARRSVGMGAALAVLTALLCLAFAGARDPETLSLAQLAQHDVLLMSCAEEVASSSADPLWCSDPSSPQCIPASPDAPKLVLWDGPEATLGSLLPVDPPRYVLLPWPRPEAEHARGRADILRLERPPRV